MQKIKLLVIAGPTASGKSTLAICLARKLGGEIVSADSRQVYRGMDIGTGKVTKAERRLARHWLLDVASPSRQYSVARFVREARRTVHDIVRRGKLPIVCGGTGFWVDALVYGQSIPEVKPDLKLRARLRKLPTARLYARLQELDPARAAAIDRHNPVRLIRALEIVLTTGKPVPPRKNGSYTSFLRAQSHAGPRAHALGHEWPAISTEEERPFELLYLGVSRPFPELKRRIVKRLDARLKSGMVAEVRRLRSQGVSWRRLESLGLEYRWVARYLQKKIPRTYMRDGLLHDIVAYAKRQLTWWRKNPDVRWTTSPSEASRRVADWLSL